MELRTLLLQVEGGVHTVTLNRPDRRNAMSLEMVNELRAALVEAEGDAAARVVVLRGAGGHFCSGGDVADLSAASARAAEGKGDPVAEVSRQFGRLCLAYRQSRLAVVVVLEGTVMGGGFGLACVADLAIAAPSAVFRLPETSLGLVPAQIAPFLLDRLGFSEAKRLAVTGQTVGAEEALRLGLVHGVHPAGEPLELALQDALAQILICAPEALAATKSLLLQARSETPETMIDEAAAVFSRALRSAEGQAGARAFFEKRPPPWAIRAGK